MPTPRFSLEEYKDRLYRVRKRMVERRIDLLLVSDPANMNYLTGFDAWSFYVPQVVAVPLDASEDPLWIGRMMDVASGRLTVFMPHDRVVGYPEIYVQQVDRHPMDWIGDHLVSRSFGSGRIAVEMDADYYSVRAHERLKAAMPNAAFVDAALLVNWVRAVKSETEVDYMRQAARLVRRVMETAYDVIEPGVRQCDAIAAIYAAQIGGDAEFGGDITGLCPIIMSGEAAAAPHPFWTDERFQNNQTSAIELGAARCHYHAALARTMHLGRPPQRLVETAKVVEEGLEAALAAARPGAEAADVEAAWRTVIERNGLKKESRIGYSIGVGYPPDWGEHTISLRAGDHTILEANNTFHIILGMWMDEWGMELSETVLITDRGAECLTDFSRSLYVKP